MPCISGLRRIFALLPVSLLILAAPSPCAEPATDAALAAVQKAWAHIKYQLPKNQRKAAFHKLYARTKQIRITHTGKAGPLLWEGIILSDYAGERGGLRALQMIKRSRDLFEKALKINPDVSHGAAYTQLGMLYYEVPDWPLGFGDMDKARSLLKKGLSLSPNGLDANYFMGKFLLRQKKYREAARYFQRAMHAPARPAMPVADAGRKADTARLLRQTQR